MKSNEEQAEAWRTEMHLDSEQYPAMNERGLLMNTFMKCLTIVAVVSFSCLSVGAEEIEIPILIPEEETVSVDETVIVSADETEIVLTGETETMSADETQRDQQYLLEPGVSYSLDLDGDGSVENFSYITDTQENAEGGSHAVLELSVNGEMVYSVVDEEWSYYWKLCQVPLENGPVSLVVSSSSDNDWTSQVLFLTMAEEGDTFTAVEDLAVLTRQSEEHPENLLSGWARTGMVTGVSSNSFTLCWYETTASTGVISVEVTYEIDAEGTIMSESPDQAEEGADLSENSGQAEEGTVSGESFGRLEDGREWTAWRIFDVMKEPGSEELSFQVTPGDIVFLTELRSLNGQQYIKCRNTQGAEGWYADPSEYYSEEAEDGSYLSGYFKEAQFAG